MKYFLSVLLGLFTLSIFAQKPVTSGDLDIFGDHVFIKLSVDGSEPLDFIFDTGDGLTIIDTDIALGLGVALDHSNKTTSAQGSVEGTLTRHNYIDMSGVRLESDIAVYATSLKHLEISIGRNIDGIIGYDLLHHYTVVLDEMDKKIKLYDPEKYTYTGIGERYELGFEKAMPYTSATVTLNDGEQLTGNFFVSTGAGTSLDFNTRFAEKNNIIERTGQHYSYLTKGIGNAENLHYEGRVKEFRLGKLKYENMPVGISTAKKGVMGHKKIAGIIGNRILKNYIMIIDRENEAMYLERHIRTGKDLHVNACGFEIQMDPDSENMMVHKVYELGPGVEQGVKLHDVMVSVNGTACSELTLPEVVKLLNEPGQEVTLEFLDAGAIKKITFVPKELI